MTRLSTRVARRADDDGAAVERERRRDAVHRHVDDWNRANVPAVTSVNAMMT